ncbi:MAG: ZIP family metal transporter [Flavisolibacter sp.]
MLENNKHRRMYFMVIPLWAKATFWGFVSGSALLVGASLGYWVKVPKKIIAFVMGFGSGVLISALAFDLMDEAYQRGGFDSTAIGFVSGAVVYSLINYFLSKKGAKHRKRSGGQQPSEEENSGSGLAIAAGALLDGIPESIAIGVSMIEGGVVSTAAVIAIFLSNIPESLSSTTGMKNAGRKPRYIFGVWGTITLISTLASLCGYSIFKNFSPDVTAASIAVAAGAILAMLSDTMMPEAFEEGHDFTGVITVIGFLAAFMLTKLGG